MARTHTVKKGTVASVATATPVETTAPVVIPELHTVPEADELLPTFHPLRFDPIEFVRSRITNERARVSIFRSMAWYLDTAIINELRGVFFKVYESCQVEGIYESYNEFINAMKEQDARESNLVEQGFMRGSGVQALRVMLNMRDDWHDVCYDLNAKHEKPSIANMIRNEKEQTLDALSETKLRALAEDLSDDDAEEAEALFADLASRNRLQARKRFEAAKERMDVLVGMHSFISNTNTSPEREFVQLPTPVRARLIEGMLRVVKNSMVELASDRRITVLDYVAVRKELKSAIAELEPLLTSRLCDDEGADIVKH